jgi:3-oxoacyl-[acyl-carrier protein] reductase
MGRIGDPAEFGAVCAFVCSQHAGYLTGQTIVVDGGSTKGVY